MPQRNADLFSRILQVAQLAAIVGGTVVLAFKVGERDHTITVLEGNVRMLSEVTKQQAEIVNSVTTNLAITREQLSSIVREVDALQARMDRMNGNKG